ncbi:peptidoglycan DD-metalloendopeptidase family protein [Endozoicomonas sp. Mp262]|uniref:peptidoglycan DD-metalloendopeptidase family protein n=1 Tax=Endozoicomonas sp. Mp262 TaxID=2919499 RepID=UPI0021D8E839
MISFLAYLLAGCAHDPASVQVTELRHPPKVTRGVHTVKKGESLYSIAWLYGRDFNELADSNGIKVPYVIYPGQNINLEIEGGRKTSKKYPVTASKKDSHKSSVVKKNTVNFKKKEQLVSGGIHWQWPAFGRVIEIFSSYGRVNKGIDIEGNLGDSVMAAASGEVVYAGSELSGYGRLIILKHNNSYLSAYAHNRELHVREGDLVKAGQKIAEIGSTGATEPKLHFEIRRNGKPVDPMGYLPMR